MWHKYIILSLISSTAWSMCKTNHNPHVYCLKVQRNFVVTKSKNNKYCEMNYIVKGVFRPKNTYEFNSNLDKISYKKQQKLKLPIKYLNIKKGALNIFQKKEECQTLQKHMMDETLLVRLSCYDEDPRLESYTPIKIDSNKAQVLDPWTQKKIEISCT